MTPATCNSPARTARTTSRSEALWVAHHARLHRYCRWLTGSAEEADDLVQEAFLRVMERLDSLEGVEELGGYLRVTARNVYLNRRRADRRLVWDGGDVIEATVSGAGTVDEEAERRHDLRTLTSALGRISPRHRKAIALAAGGVSGRDAAEEMGLCENAAHQLLHRARKSLRNELAMAV